MKQEIEIKDINIKLNITIAELDVITSSLNGSLEDIETGNDDFSLRTIDVGRTPFYKVDKGLCPHNREWYIKYSRLASQLNRLYNKVKPLDNT